MVEPLLVTHPHSGLVSREPRVNPSLTAVIVNHAAWPDTARLARSLLRSRSGRRGALEVVIVDNRSPKHVLASRLRRWRGVSVRRWGQNRGFAPAVNEGCRLGRGEWLLVLNPDIELPPRFADDLAKWIDRIQDKEPRTGIVGFQLRNEDGTRQHSFGDYPTLFSVVSRLLLPRVRRKYSARRIVGRSPVPWVTGCCLLIRRECLEDLGGFDERFFLYYEDVDLCKRAREKGWSVWFEPALWVKHLRPLQNRKPCPSLRAITRNALLTYAHLHWPAWQRCLLGGLISIEAWLRQLRASWRRDSQGAWVFRELGAMARCLAWGREEVARQHLHRVVEKFSNSFMVSRDQRSGSKSSTLTSAGKLSPWSDAPK